jgi:hypothetical protein
MDVQYFVKFIGDRYVTVAKARSSSEADTLRRNQYEPTTPEFYHWVRDNTRPLAASR